MNTRLDALAPGLLGRPLRRLDRLDLVGTLDPATLAKVLRDQQLDARLTEDVGFRDREIRRDRDAAKTSVFEEALHDLREELRAAQAFCGEVLRAEVVHVHDLRGARFLADAPFLERARDDDELFDVLERDDRIGGKELRRVVHVRESVPVRIEEERLAIHAPTIFGVP